MEDVVKYYERLKSKLKTFQMLLVNWKKGLLIACHVILLVLLIAEVSGAYPSVMDLVFIINTDSACVCVSIRYLPLERWADFVHIW